MKWNPTVELEYGPQAPKDSCPLPTLPTLYSKPHIALSQNLEASDAFYFKHLAECVGVLFRGGFFFLLNDLKSKTECA